jgi:hypothetical protein
MKISRKVVKEKGKDWKERQLIFIHLWDKSYWYIYNTWWLEDDVKIHVSSSM